MEDLHKVADYLFEIGMLAKTPRSGFFFLGSGQQSVAEHSNRAAHIGFALAHLNGKADVAKVVQMCLFHDVSEARISDLNYVHQKYTTRNEDGAHADLVKPLPFGKAIADLLAEYEARQTLEARIAKDTDNLELLLSLKEQVDIGNERARSWIPALLKRLHTDEGRALAAAITETDSDHWWFGDKDDEWWVNRNKSKR